MFSAGDSFGYLFKKNDPIHSLNNFATSTQTIDRENYPRVLEHIIHTQPYVLSRDYKEILSTLDIVSSDSEISVRSNLSSWLQRLCVSCLDREQSVNSEFGRCVLEKVLSITIRYLTDDPGVRCGAFETLSYLIEKGFLDKATTEETVCPVVEKLSRKPLDTFDEELYAIFIHLMVKIVPIVGYAKTYDLVYDRFVEMCRCKEHFVRRECATAFPVMCEVLGDDLFEKSLLPIFMKLCDDEIWTVRKACAEVLPIVALLCTLEKRRKVLVPAMKKFMFDPSQWVIMAALKNLGQFLTTFAQLRVLGLAYNSNLELMVTNAADQQSFNQLDMRRVTYGNQPTADVLVKNFESYEKRFRDSIHRYALLSLVKSNEEPWKARGDEMINVEVYLYSIVYADRRSQRLSTGSNSDDGGISKISDFSYKYYVRKSLSSSSLCAPPPVQLHRGGRNYDEKNPLNRFLRYCWPLKNNFTDAFAKQGSSGTGRGSESDDYHGGWGPDDDDYSMLAIRMKMNELDALGAGVDCGGGTTAHGDTTSSTSNSGNDNQLVPECEGTKKSSSDQSSRFEEPPSDDESVDQSFNSHQFWYISPELPLDLDFIDDDTTGDSVKKSDISNNNAVRASTPMISTPVPIARTELEYQEDNKNNNSKLASETAATSAAATAVPAAAAVGVTVTQETDPANDSDSSYGSINNNSEADKLDTDVERYCSDLQQQQKHPPAVGGVGYHQQMEAVTVGVGALAIGKEGERLKDIIKWQNEEVEWNLLEDFVHMKNINKELCFECAFNFPAIVLTFGEKFWPILSSHFFALCNDIQNTVRRTMAASISKVALIIGREQATRDLVAPYTEFLMDSDEIKIEVVNTLAEFLNVIDGSEHETLMDQLSLCLQQPLNLMNWRFREAIARQIVQLVRMHHKIRKENCLLYLTGLAMRLMIDKYDFVRKAGVDAFVECAQEFQKNGSVFKFFTENFAHSTNWRRRQTYIITAGKMLETGSVEVETFRKHVLHNILGLVGDAVPNVRIQLGKFLKDIVLPHASFSSASPDTNAIEQALTKLRSDPDRDVRGHTDGYQSPEDESIAVGAPEMTATGSTIDSGSSSSTSSTSSLSSPPPPPHPVSSLMEDIEDAREQQHQQQQHQQQQQQSGFPILSNDTWYFDTNQQQEYEF
ncbi:serine/threonine-protein phosphatase 4 regulatory subunit 1-like isoform X2 [Malaya genurostris]|uniref:serine/threonine-protein phosphatase 4 regulatory subunit 1-like isoform X2 n=1 Tax=Malaya genurostris TaxID=325434 RepID=UPI0026F396A6|nr:serine/threonine-protein phosphatase 4 regulatory subunit 1-like isoform X2 [Malaya genurostris]XP_058463206.1 serine/threonine-protein phosphatase 4 regulatory subunit 1-like isoform X2 [Malaya genurostris]XP_058463207.1 serine/threonine-protein phosphatase 4 regulatory subunit 1-like isoform X2 [Malaya genurostris]